MPQTRTDRFLAKVHVTETCWVWSKTLTKDGYGSFWNGTANVPAHRWAYEHDNGPIPIGLDLDHLCRVRACVNPEHLEAVSRRENLHRSPLVRFVTEATKTRCVNDHERNETNTYTYVRSDGRLRRCCRVCNRLVQTRRAARKVAS